MSATFCPDCKGPHPTATSDLAAFLHMLRSHRDPFFDDTIDALIEKLTEIAALAASLPPGVTLDKAAKIVTALFDKNDPERSDVLGGIHSALSYSAYLRSLVQ